jgi:hypothetical protein
MAYNNFIDYYGAVAQGLTNHSYVHKFGNSPVGTTAASQIWSEGKPYTYLTSAQTLRFTSANANDATGGSGAISLDIYGVASGYTSQSETILLSGNTTKSSVNTYLRIFRMVVRSVGSTGYNEGKIYCIPDAAGNTVTAGVPTSTSNILASIDIGVNQTLMAIYTVPLSYTAYLISSYANCSNNTEVEIMLKARPFGECFQTKEMYHIFRGGYSQSHTIPVPYAAKTDIDMRSVSSVSASDISGGFDLLLVKAE